MRKRGCRAGRATGTAVVALFVLGVGVATTRSTGPVPLVAGGQTVARVGQPEPAPAIEPVPAVAAVPVPTVEPVRVIRLPRHGG